MAYFEKHQGEKPHERLFVRPVRDEYSDEPEDDELPEEDEELLTDEEEAELRRKGNLKVAAGVGDFLAVIIGALVILLLLTVLISLVDWVRGDVLEFLQQWGARVS